MLKVVGRGFWCPSAQSLTSHYAEMMECRLGRLKICCEQSRVGSSPTFGTRPRILARVSDGFSIHPFFRRLLQALIMEPPYIVDELRHLSMRAQLIHMPLWWNWQTQGT